VPELNQETGSESESGSGKGMGVGIVGGSRHHAEAELIRHSSQRNVPQWTGVHLRGKEFGRLANYEMGKPRLGWEPPMPYASGRGGLNHLFTEEEVFQPTYSPAVHEMQPANLDSPSK